MKKILFLLCALAFIGAAQAQFITIGKKKNKKKEAVSGQSSILTKHPAKNILKGTDDKEYYLFFDIQNKYLFFTDDKEIYTAISQFLPEVQIVGRRAEIDGPSIDPVTIFSTGDLDKQSATVGFGLNKYNSFRLYNYLLIPGKTEQGASDSINKADSTKQGRQRVPVPPKTN